MLSACVLLSLAATAQKKEGKVVYQRVSQMQFRNPNPEIAAQLPRQRTDNFELAFGNNQSIWQNIPNPDGDNGTITAPGMVVRMANINEVVHFNFGTGKRLEQRELFDREFLIEDSVRKLPWKLTEETKEILGYNARKATAQRIEERPRVSMENGEMKREMVMDTSAIVAWFTTDVPVPAGPGEYSGQLPGLILELDINKGRSVYKAIEFSPKVNLSHIKEPKGGKRVNQEQFLKERDAMMEEMRKNNPNRSIRIQ